MLFNKEEAELKIQMLMDDLHRNHGLEAIVVIMTDKEQQTTYIANGIDQDYIMEYILAVITNTPIILIDKTTNEPRMN